MLNFKWKLFLGFLTSGAITVAVTALLRGLWPGEWELLAAFSVVAAVPPAFLIAKRLNRPIQALTEGIARLADGDLQTSIAKPRTRDEFEPLIDQFNLMVGGLRERRDLQATLALREQVEQALREAGATLESRVRQRTTDLDRAVRERDRLLAHSADLIGVATFDGRFVQMNQACQEILGYSPAEITARPFVEFVHPDDVELTRREVARLAHGLPTVLFENRYRCKNGAYKWFRWTAIPVKEEAAIYAIGRDITDRRRAEAAEGALLEAAVQMRIAADIQTSLSPDPATAMEGFDVVGSSRPFAAVGGDYYDFIPTADNHFTVAIADASGHGLSAALVAAQLQACLWSLMVGQPHPLDEVLERANALLHAKTPSNCYATAMLVRVNGARRTLSFANAGHPPGLILGASGALKLRLGSTGRPLGCFERAEVGASSLLCLDVGDVVVLATDGVLEAASDGGEPFGEDRLVAAVRACLTRPAQAIADAVHEAVNLFSGGAQDDATLVVMKVTGEAAAV